jgi:flagellar basal-body rod protein FlgC
MSDLKSALSVAATGLTAQAGRLNLIAQNIANAETPGYRRKLTAFEATTLGPGETGVRLVRAGLDRRELPREFRPGHPMADDAGYVLGSNVSLTIEMADAREAQRSYEANLRSFDNARQMTRSLLDLLRR